MSDEKSQNPKKDLRTVMAQAGSALTIIPEEHFLKPLDSKNETIDKEHIMTLSSHEIIFTTMPRSAIKGKLKDVWPADQKDRKVHAPVEFELDGGYLAESDYCEDYSLPTVREHRYECLPADQALDFFKELCGWEAPDDLLDMLEKGCEDWEEQDLPTLEEYFQAELDAEVDIESLGMYEASSYSAYGLAIGVIEKLERSDRQELDLYVVEGECPGSSFTGVSFDGDIKALNQGLARLGLNMIVKA